MAKAKALDFSKVQDRGDVAPKHYPEGDYPAKVLSVKDIRMGDDKRPAWMFILKVKNGTYPLRCGFHDNELWKIRNLFVACGVSVPKKRVNVKPELVVGKTCAVTLEDNEYTNSETGKTRLSSQIAATFPLSDLDGEVVADNDEDEDEDEDEDQVTSDDEEEEEEEDEEEEEEPAPKKKSKKKAPPPEDDEDEDEDLEALDIEDL